MLLIEQPAEAKTVNTGAPRTRWRREWKGFKLALPLLLMASAMGMEATAYRLWLDDRLFCPAGILVLLLMAAFPLVAVMIAVAIPLLFACMPFLGTRLARTIRLDDKGIKLSQTWNDRVWWKQVRRWLMAPIPGCEGLVTLTLECGSPTKPGRRYWSIILASRDQKHAFLSELEHLRQVGSTAAPVVELLQPMPQRPISSRGLWALAVAFYLFVHGFPLLLVGVMPHDPKDSGSHSSEAEQAKMERLMGPVVRGLHVSNKSQLRRLFWLPGGLLTAAAVGVFVWADKRQIRETREINRTFDLELEKITRCYETGNRTDRTQMMDEKTRSVETKLGSL